MINTVVFSRGKIAKIPYAAIPSPFPEPKERNGRSSVFRLGLIGKKALSRDFKGWRRALPVVSLPVRSGGE
jgi:hypothetical protein